jgi:hypothetical protein
MYTVSASRQAAGQQRAARPLSGERADLAARTARPFTDAEIDLLERMTEEGVPLAMMARELGRSVPSVRWQMVRQGFWIGRRRRSKVVVVRLFVETFEALALAAKQRGVLISTLFRLLLEVIVKDGLISSLLDYGEHYTPQESSAPRSLGAAAIPQALPLTSLRVELTGYVRPQPHLAATMH